MKRLNYLSVLISILLLLPFRGMADSIITESDFNSLIDEITAIWKPIAQLHGAELVIMKDWQSPVVNAMPHNFGSTWVIGYAGGLARRPEVTKDAFQLLVCHELGHLFGGYPFYDGMSVEGQADYFATRICLREMWGNDLNRISGASLSLSKLFAHLAEEVEPTPETPDQEKVSVTLTSHPRSQCRLDTFLAGARCDQDYDLKVIPTEERTNACVLGIGARPKCWFKE